MPIHIQDYWECLPNRSSSYHLYLQVCIFGYRIPSNMHLPSYNILENVAYDRILLPSALNHDFDVIAFGTLALRTKQNRETLMHEVWGEEFVGESRTVDMHIKTLRQKLGDAAASIKTVVGIGYRMEVVG